MKDQNDKKFNKWFKGLGLAGFLFFFKKGLIWLAVFFGAAQFISC